MVEDVMKVASNFYKVLLENDRVRVLVSRSRPGDKAAMHSHPAVVAVGVTDGKFKFTFPDGQSADVELKSGEAMYADSTAHTAEHTGSGEAVVILVELK